MKKISKVIVQIVIAEFDDAGDLIDEQQTQPIAVYRAKTPDLWAWLDRDVLPNATQSGVAVPPSAPRKSASKNGRATA